MSLNISTSRAISLKRSNKGNFPIAAFENLASTATLASTPATATMSNLVSGDTFSYWTPDTTGITTASVEFTFGSSQAVNFIGLDAHNLKSHDASVAVEYSVDGGSSWVVAGTSVTPTDSKALGWYFETIEAAKWRVVVSGFTAGDDVAIGVCVIASVLTFERPFYQGFTPPISANDVELLNNVSRGNHLLGNSVVRKGLKIMAPFSKISSGFVRGLEFQKFSASFNSGAPFFFAWNPTKNADLRYCWRSGAALVPSNAGPVDLMAFSLEMRAYGE